MRLDLRSSDRTYARLLVLCLSAAVVPSAHGSTVAEYFFNGSASYDAATGILAVGPDATVFASANLPAGLSVIPTGQPGANVIGSQVDLALALTAGTVIDTGAFTIASFGASPTQPTVSLYLGNGAGGTAASPVLTGTISNAQVVGQDGTNVGVLTAYLHPTGGLASAFFSDPSNVIALNFDLTTTFGPTMYASSFGGQINGQVQSVVPLPPSGWLLGSGLAAALVTLRRRGRPNSPAPLPGESRA